MRQQAPAWGQDRRQDRVAGRLAILAGAVCVRHAKPGTLARVSRRTGYAGAGVAVGRAKRSDCGRLTAVRHSDRA